MGLRDLRSDLDRPTARNSPICNPYGVICTFQILGSVWLALNANLEGLQRSRVGPGEVLKGLRPFLRAYRELTDASWWVLETSEVTRMVAKLETLSF